MLECSAWWARSMTRLCRFDDAHSGKSRHMAVTERAQHRVMNFKTAPDQDELMQRIARDLMDSYDEEIELEIEDRVIDGDAGHPVASDKAARQAYFTELFRLQGELVKLQDWVQHSKQKVVILFEGRDAAGKGG